MNTAVKTSSRVMPGFTRRPEAYATPKNEKTLDSLIDEIEARGLGRPCISRAEILAAIDSGGDTNFLIKTKDLESIVLANLTEEGFKNPAAHRDKVIRLVKSQSDCFAQKYLLVNTAVFEDAMSGAIMEERHNNESNSESVSFEEIMKILDE